MAIWTNSDGLQVRFGLDQCQVAREGSPMQAGEYKVYTFDLQWGATGSAGGFLPLVADGKTLINKTNSVFLPAGMLLKEATLVVETAFTSGGSATLDIGLQQEDGTNILATGLTSALALTAIDTIGETNVLAGASISTVLANNSYLTCQVKVADYLTGRAKLIVKMMPIGA